MRRNLISVNRRKYLVSKRQNGFRDMFFPTTTMYPPSNNYVAGSWIERSTDDQLTERLNAIQLAARKYRETPEGKEHFEKFFNAMFPEKPTITQEEPEEELTLKARLIRFLIWLKKDLGYKKGIC